MIERGENRDLKACIFPKLYTGTPENKVPLEKGNM